MAATIPFRAALLACAAIASPLAAAAPAPVPAAIPAAAPAATAVPAPVNPWMTPAIVAEQAAAAGDAGREAVANRRAKMLVAAMTLPQKLQQLTGAKPEILPELPQCFGGRHVSAIAALNIPTFRITNGPVGLGQNDCVSPEVANKPLTIPGFGVISAAYGHPSSAKATALPSATAVAATFDPAVAARFGEVIANEMNQLGLHVFEAPGVNLARLPILGRNFEYFGEDPYLAGAMATAEIKAIQDRGLIAMVKHYVANEQETNRMQIQETVDRQALRELYLLPFEMAVKDGKVAAVMCSYNYLNGQSACENREVLTDVLRGDWKFSGYVQSDFFATKSTVATLANGLDHEMPLPIHWAPEKISGALGSGALNEAQVDTALVRRFTQMFKAGIFDRPVVHQPIDFAAGGKAAREIGARSVVLLQNNGALPLNPAARSVVLIGKASQVYAQQAVAGGSVVGEPMGGGGGSSDVVPNYTVAPIDGLRQAMTDGSRAQLVLVDDDNRTATVDGKPASFAEVLALAGKAEAVVIMAGTVAEEGADRATFTDASGHQLAAPAAAGSTLDWYARRSNHIATTTGDNVARNSRTTDMIAALMAARSTSGRTMAAKSVLVLKDNAGPSLPASLVGPRGPAILEAWLPGQEDGNIVADALFGRTNPAGKLPVTIPLTGKGFLDRITTAQFPGVIGPDGKTQTVTYSEGLAIGYRWYDANADGRCGVVAGRNPCVAFPFGHGLSYTRFALGQPRLEADAAKGTWTARVRVSNTGPRTGAQVVQAYVTLPPAPGLPQPPKRLIGFARLDLAPGASGEAAITLDPGASHHPLSVWNEAEKRWVIPQGTFKVWLGTSSAPADLALAGTFTR